MKFEQHEIGELFIHRLSRNKMILTGVSGDHPTREGYNRGIMSAIEFSEMGGMQYVTKDLYSFEFEGKHRSKV